MKVSVRLADEFVSQLDQAASSAGITRSQFVTAAIEQKLISRPAEVVPPRVSRSRRAGRRQVNLSVPADMVPAIDRAAASFGMRRNQWILGLVRGRLGGPSGKAAVSPVSKQAINALIYQVVRIGRNVDQAVHALHSAGMAGSQLDQANIVRQLIDMQAEVREVVEQSRSALLAELQVDRDYWRGGQGG